jgi:pyruvate/2-oxoglutarate dehydrogenase complex dihydrolipoamide dehydrogenase (E3) component
MVAIVSRCLRREGVKIRLGAEMATFENRTDGLIVTRLPEEDFELVGSHLVVAGGGAPVLEGLNLKAARIRVGPFGLQLDRYLRTSNPKVYAVDHLLPLATQQAEVAFRNAVLRLPTRFDPFGIPRLVHCDPEMASVGLTEEQAREKTSSIRVLRAPFAENSRAMAEGATEGHVKVVTTPSGKILGCSIVGGRAHDLATSWALAMAKRLTVSDLAGVAFANPAYSQVSRGAAIEFLKLSAQAPWIRRALGLVRRWG